MLFGSRGTSTPWVQSDRKSSSSSTMGPIRCRCARFDHSTEDPGAAPILELDVGDGRLGSAARRRTSPQSDRSAIPARQRRTGAGPAVRPLCPPRRRSWSGALLRRHEAILGSRDFPVVGQSALDAEPSHAVAPVLECVSGATIGKGGSPAWSIARRCSRLRVVIMALLDSMIVPWGPIGRERSPPGGPEGELKGARDRSESPPRDSRSARAGHSPSRRIGSAGNPFGPGPSNPGGPGRIRRPGGDSKGSVLTRRGLEPDLPGGRRVRPDLPSAVTARRCDRPWPAGHRPLSRGPGRRLARPWGACPAIPDRAGRPGRGRLSSAGASSR